MEKVGGSLCLQALTNRRIYSYMSSAAEPCTQQSALELFALTAKSLESPGFVPSNARDMVKRHQIQAMQRLKKVAAADGGPAAAQILAEAQRLKKLNRELQACSERELGHVRSSRVAKRLVSMFKLGHQAYKMWAERQRAQGSRRPSSPSPSPRRGKRKSPVRPASAPSRFCGDGASRSAQRGCLPGSRDLPLWQRSSAGASSVAQAAGGLQPKQLVFNENTCSSGNSNTSLSTGADDSRPAQAASCDEWQEFKAFLASPRRTAQLAPITAPVAAAALPGSRVEAGSASPMDVQVEQGRSLAEMLESAVWELQQGQQRRQQQGVGMPSWLQQTSPGPPAMAAEPTCVERPAVGRNAPAASAAICSQHIHNSPQVLEVDTAAPACGRTLGLDALAPPRTAGLRGLWQTTSPAERQAAAADILAADVMMLLGEAAGGEAGSDGRVSHCSPDVEAAAGMPLLPLPAPLPLASKQHLPSPLLQLQRAEISRHPGNQQGMLQLRKLAIEVPGCVLRCDRGAVHRAAAQEAPAAGGSLPVGCTFNNLNSAGRADSILRPVDVPRRAAEMMQQRRQT